MSNEELNCNKMSERKIARARIISISLFFLGVFSFLGVDSYDDYYIYFQSKVTGIAIDYNKVKEFCGWTGGKYPGETDLEYGLRSTWNMTSAMFSMVIIVFTSFGILFGILFTLFYVTGGFNP